jgi:hypothetical protein
MKKNENIFISLQIQKDAESKKLLFSVQFDKSAPNFSTENDTIFWYPTCDEIDFIAEAFKLIGGVKFPENIIEKQQISTTHSEDITMESSHKYSDIRINPVEDDIAIEVTPDVGSSRIKNKENNERIYFQADEKKIDEILNRKKQATREDYATKSSKKILIDRMLKQKKKK